VAVFSYSHRQGEYSYDIGIDEISVGHFRARIINLTRRMYGESVRVDARLQAQDGATTDEAVSKLRAAVEGWVKTQSPPA
jgi:hypothetical protein